MTSKQRAYLRSLAVNTEPVIYIGKDGVTEATLAQADIDLEAHELVKGCVQQNSPMSAREALTALCEALDAEPVQQIGRRFVLYRPSKEDPRIVLP